MEPTMSKLTSLIRRAPKRLSAVALVFAAAIIIPTAALAWGPNRDTFTIANPSDHVQFNSITNNPNIGDERNFVGIREKGSTNTWYDSLNAQNDKTYIVRMYVHNNAATSLNLVAKDVKAKVNLPTTTGKEVDITGFVSASNVGEKAGTAGTYAEVYDNAKLTSTENFNVAYVSGSLRYENNALPAGTTLPESIFTSAGAKLGYDKLDGNIPGCFQYSGYVSFEIKPQFATPNFSVVKEVRKAGDKTFVESVNAKAGDTLNYRVIYTNTGATNQTAVVLKDTMPKGISYVPGTVKILDAANPASALVAGGDKLFTSGVNIGNYTAGSNAIVVFNATVDKAETLPLCGPNTLTNKASAQPSGQNPKDDTASTTVNKECLPSKISVCELSTKNIISINETDFDTKKHSKNLDDCKTPGTINVCELSTKNIISIKETDFDAAKHSKNLDDCKATPPVTPPELPQTGMTENVVAVIGLGAIVASAAYYIASRRALS